MPITRLIGQNPGRASSRCSAPALTLSLIHISPRAKGIKTRVSYAGECSLEEAVSQYLAARANSRAIPALAEAGA